MSYNRKQHLHDNILAIQTALELERSGQIATEEQQIILRRYSGFGGISPILLPARTEEDRKTWNKTDQPLFDDIKKLHQLLRDLSPDEQTYKNYISSLQGSALTAFYTPPEIVQAIAQAIHTAGINPLHFLEPSAGSGIFLDTFKPYQPHTIHAFENDLLTGKILKALHLDDNIHIQGFESIDSQFNNYFDVVSSNIPFNNFAVFDPTFTGSNDPARNQAAQTIHNYFFLKAVDCAREGGIIAFITTRGVMDAPTNAPIRQYLMKHSNLVTAIRLPDNLFIENSNVKVGTDLIILQKNTHKKELSKKEKHFLQTRLITTPTVPEGIHTNNYFMGVDNIIFNRVEVATNQYGKPATQFLWDGTTKQISNNLLRLMQREIDQNLDKTLYQSHISLSNQPETPLKNPQQDHPLSLFDLFGITEEEQTGKKRSKTKPNIPKKKRYFGTIQEYHKPGMLVIDENQVGYLGKIMAPDIEFKPLPATPQEMTIIQDYIPLRESYFLLSEYENRFEEPNQQLREELNKNYRNFVEKHGDLNEKANSRIILLDRPGREILSLETFTNSQKKLADIFYKPVSFITDKHLNTHDINEVFLSSVNKYGYAHIPYMTQISDYEEEEISRELQGRIYYNPLSDNYELKEKFLAGNVISKAEDIEQFLSEHPDHPKTEGIKESLEALHKITPKPIPFADLDFNLGERWIPTKYYEQYTSKIFNTKVTILYAKELDLFYIDYKDITPEMEHKYGVIINNKRAIKGDKLLPHAMLNTVPQITKTIVDEKGEEITVPDREAIHKANLKIEEIRAGFPKWLAKRPEKEKEALTKIYNHLFNCRVKPEYDGSFLKFPNLNLKGLGIKDLYDTQKRAIWMNLVNGGGLVDHKVGLGKTLVMCVLAYEMKRLKLAHKPLILALKANVNEIAEKFLLAYPDAKILYPSENDFSPKNRKKLFAQIKNNDWDAVIITHDQFLKIPMDLNTQKEILEEQINSLQKNLEAWEESTGKSASTKLIKGLKKREKNLEARLKTILAKIDSRKDDTITFADMKIDHISIDEWHRFKNLPYTTRYQNVAGLGNPKGSDKALNLLIATRYIQKQANKDLRITGLTGTPLCNSLVEIYGIFYLLRPRLLEELQLNSFDSWAAVFTKKSTEYEFSVTGEIKPKERFREFIKVPELALMYSEITDYSVGNEIQIDRPEENVQLISLPATPQQEEFGKNLILFAQTGNAEYLGRAPLSDNEKQAKMLIAMDYGQRMSLDMRLINPYRYHDEPGNKISVCATMLAKHYHEYDFCKGTQVVFCDTGTPKSGKWNIYTALKEKLVREHGLPAHEISFIHEATSRDQRNKMFEKFKEGTIRILLGSTDKLGTGVNIQDLIVKMYDLDIPLRPDKYDQRHGRGGRPGNLAAKNYTNNKLDIYVFATQKSPDTFRFNLLLNKKLFINQFRKGDIQVRRLNEGMEDNGSGIDYASFLASISDNPDIQAKLKAERKITVLESEFKVHIRNQQKAESKLNFLNPQLDKYTRKFMILQEDWESLNQAAPRNKRREREGNLILTGITPANEAEKGKYLQHLSRTIDTEGQKMEVGCLGNFKIHMQTVTRFGEKKNQFSIQGKKEYLPDSPYFMDYENPTRSFINLLERLPIEIKDYEQRIDHLEKEIPVLKEVVETPWEKEEELKNLKIRLRYLDQKIEEANRKEEQSKEQQTISSKPEKEKIADTPQKETKKRTHIRI